MHFLQIIVSYIEMLEQHVPNGELFSEIKLFTVPGFISKIQVLWIVQMLLYGLYLLK
jgi:hypothetical protein